MKARVKKIVAYIFRSWEDETRLIYPRLKILPPILYDLLAAIILIGILYQVGVYLRSLL